MDFLEYSEAVKEDRGDLTSGRLKLSNNQVIFKNHKTGKIDNLGNNDIEKITWQKMAGAYCIRIMMKNGQIYRYGGFKEKEKENIEKFVSKFYSMPLETQDFSLKGWNWGTANFEGSVLNFDLMSKKSEKSEKAFEIPLSNVSHCTSAKNEVTVEFHQNDDAPVSLMEMRFHIPTVDGTDSVQLFIEQVLSNASIIRETGECIVVFKELQCLTPRGRYDIKMYPTFIQLHGKTFDYKIPLSSVLRLFQLPHKDSRQVFFVLSLDPPIKQGQTRYHFLILLFNKEENISVNLGLSDKEIKEKYDGKLNKTMSGSTYEVISKIMRAMIQRKITLPDQTFSKDMPAISCSYRASNGLMYPLERGFIYLHKPPVHIRFDEITSINFARSGGSTRSFDFEIETKSSIVHTFSSIDKEEYSKLYDFVTNKKLRVKNRGTEPVESKIDDELIDSDIDDDEPDAYLQRVREEGRIREEGGDSDESDESFNPGQEDDEVAEEFDSNASSSSSDDSNDDAGDGGSGSEKKHRKHHRESKKKSKKSKDETKSSSRKKSKKSKKDENKPKRPQSAFFLWMNENREQIKKQLPGASLTEITKKAGDLWKDLSKEEKSKYEEMYAKAKKQYEKELSEYKASGGNDNEDDRKKSSKKSEQKKSTTKSPIKSGQFKSKEYISSASSSSDEDDGKDQNRSRDDYSDRVDDRNEKKKLSTKKSNNKKADNKKLKAKKDASSSDQNDSDEEILSTPESSSESD
ncbi:FACT complex subunit SSRP1 [Sarcoptes scabiei]|uniref:FACT complex subunit SSRP1 n=1 Tax=Sarcoptes scabiei TaxID=52283 RepID=A0A834R330_SARSC|nr:FACT complex subunit SSRP1 [Sarcoptes scabiei]